MGYVLSVKSCTHTQIVSTDSIQVHTKRMTKYMICKYIFIFLIVCGSTLFK